MARRDAAALPPERERGEGGSRRLRILLWLALAAFLAALLASPFTVIRNDRARLWILDRSLNRGVLPAGWRLTIDRIAALGPEGITLRGVHVLRAEPDSARAGAGAAGFGADAGATVFGAGAERAGAEREWASIGRLDLRWSPRRLLWRQIRAERLIVDSLTVDLDVPPPVFTSARREGGAAEPPAEGAGRMELPSIRLARLEVRGARAVRAGAVRYGADLVLHDLSHERGQVQGTLARLVLQDFSDTLEAVLDGGRMAGELPHRFRIEGAKISSDGLRASLDGQVSLPTPEDRTLRASVASDIRRIEPEAIRPARRLGVPFGAADSLSGTVRLDVAGRRFALALDLAGRLLDAPLARLEVVSHLAGDSLRVERLEVDHRAATASASGLLLLDEKRISGDLSASWIDLTDPALARLLPAEIPAVRLKGEVAGDGSLQANEPRFAGAADLPWVELDGREIGPIRFAGSYAGRILALDSLRAGDPGTVGILRASGRWDTRAEGAIAGTAEVRGVRLEDWLAPRIHVDIRGPVDARFDVAGTTGRPTVRGAASSAPFRVLDLLADRVALDDVEGTLRPFDLRGRASGRVFDVFGVPADTAAFDVAMAKTIEVEGFARVDSLLARTRTTIFPAEPGSLLVSSLRFEPGSLPAWEGDGRGVVRWYRGNAWLERIAMRSPDGSVAGKLHVGRGGSSLDGEVRADSVDLEFFRRLLDLPDSSLAGSAGFRATIDGSALRPGGTARLAANGLLIERWPVGSLETRLTADSSGWITVDSLDAGVGRGWGRISGSRVRVQPPLPIPRLLEALADSLDPLIAATRIEGRIAVDSLSLGRLFHTAIEGAEGANAILATSPDPMTARIRTVRNGQQGAAGADQNPVEGEIHLEVTASGTGAAPGAAARGSIRRLKLYQARADSLLFGASYLPGTATLDSLVWHRGARQARAQGEMPLVASLVPGGTAIPDGRPFHLDAELPEIDLALLGALTPDIQDPEGMLSGRISLRGTRAAPWASGALSIRDGALRIPNREERIHDIDGDLTLDSTGVRIETLGGKVGSAGRARAEGWFRSPTDFEFTAAVQDATVFETGLYHFTVDGEIEVFPVVSDFGSYYQAVGRATVQEGAIVGDLAKVPPPPPRPPTKRPPWRAEIDIDAPGNVRMSTAVASVDLGRSEDLHLSFVEPLINISGKVYVLGGRYRVFNNVFTITDGSVEFRDTGRGPEPILDVNAETEVSDWPAAGEAGQMVTVRIHATGPITELAIDFTSEPARTEDEIVELLSLGRWTGGQAGALNVADPSRQYIFTELVSQIESQMSQMIAPLENVSVQPGLGPGEAWKLNVRQNVLPQVQLAYTRELSPTADQELNLHYNLRGQLYLNAGLERRQTQAGASDRYSLDLKLRFEYE